MSSTYETARLVRATPKRLFEAWLDSREHSNMTGRPVAIGPQKGAAFSTADGQITG